MIHYTVCLVMFGTALLGVTAGVIGVFAMLRRHSLLGDAMCHAAFPGIVAMFLITSSKHPALLMSGGALTACLGALCITAITTYSSLKKDAALGMVLSLFFGLGLVLMAVLQKKPVASQAILSKFLFGNASTLLQEDIYVMIIASTVILLAIFLFKKEFALLAFDEHYARVVGYATIKLDSALVLMLVAAIMVGLQTVGVILMSTLLIAPAVIARQWTYHLSRLILIACTTGAVASIVGCMLSGWWHHMPTGPVIVLVLSVMVLCSIMVAPRVGRVRKV